MAEKRSRGNIGLAAAVFALGAATGSVIGLLLAPAPGRVTRKRLVTQFRNARRRTTQKLERQLHDAREWLVERVMNGYSRRPLRRRIAHHVSA